MDYWTKQRKEKKRKDMKRTQSLTTSKEKRCKRKKILGTGKCWKRTIKWRKNF